MLSTICALIDQRLHTEILSVWILKLARVRFNLFTVFALPSNIWTHAAEHGLLNMLRVEDFGEWAFAVGTG